MNTGIYYFISVMAVWKDALENNQDNKKSSKYIFSTVFV